MKHAVYSPSSMYRIIGCPASVMESQFIPQKPPSEYAVHGTILHDWVTKEWNHPGVVDMSELSDEDKQMVYTCIDYLHMVIASCTGPTMRMEHKVSLETWGIDEVWGTADVVLYDRNGDDIHVIDWKFGSGVPVYVEWNEQLLTYGAAVARFPSHIDKVILHIVQPPLDYQESWEISYEDLKVWVWDTLQPAVNLAKSQDPPYNPSTKSCRFCPAANVCRARHAKQMENAAEVFQAYRKMPHITMEELATAMGALKELEQYKKGLFKYAEETYMRGEAIPGWKMVRGRSNRRWIDEKATMKWLDENNDDVADRMFDPPKLKSPSKLEKLDRTLKKNKDFQDLITKPPGKPQLVQESDKRPAIEPNRELENAFKEVIV